jgi:hypothetical protein
MASMSIDLPAPNLAVAQPLDPNAPRAARYHVGHVGHPSPDLRDAIVLLTSELVSRAVEHCPPRVSEVVELRVWMSSEVVRVEVCAPEMLPPDVDDGSRRDLGGLLFGQLADRWSVSHEHDGHPAMWFEIDRHRTRVHSAV